MRQLALLLAILSPSVRVAAQTSATPANPVAPDAQNTASPTATQAPGTPYSLTTQSNLVFVPTEVRTKKGEILFGLTADQFVLEDTGVRQRFHLEEELSNPGIALVVVAQCSGAAAFEIAKLRGLPTMLDSIVGEAPREIAVVTYGDEPTLVGDFTADPAVLGTGLAEVKPCDETSVRTFDAVNYANQLLDQRKDHLRRVILLLSETRDHGSHTDRKQLMAALGRNKTIVDSVAFSRGRDEALEELKHGGGGGILELLLLAVNALRTNAAKELARLSGGDYANFTTQRGFDGAMNRIANRVHNFYNLSFQPPSDSAPGFHPLRVTVPAYPDAVLRARESYWFGPPPPAPRGPAPDPVPDATPAKP